MLSLKLLELVLKENIIFSKKKKLVLKDFHVILIYVKKTGFLQNEDFKFNIFSFLSLYLKKIKLNLKKSFNHLIVY